MKDARAQTFAEVCQWLRSESKPVPKSVEWMPGDASNRSYGRLRYEQGPTEILMVMNAPEAFKSEEVTGGRADPITELPFVTIAREFRRQNVMVPKVKAVESQSRFLVTEDFGDELLYDRRQSEPALQYYKKALDELLKIQKLKAIPLISQRRFTEELLSWETEHFVEYMYLKRDIRISEAALKEVRGFFSKIVRVLERSPYIVVHRDYHSKNLMLIDGGEKIGVIDFQDALMGPVPYDLASLLRDSYVQFSDGEENELLAHYEKQGGQLDRELYAMMSVQRNSKAAGRFYYISLVKGRDTHLPYVKPTMRRILKTLRDLNETRIVQIFEETLAKDIA